MSKNDIVVAVVLLVIGIVAALGFNELNPDFMRYEVYHVDGKPCYVFDWKTGKRLPVTDELLEKATGTWTPCDPDMCK